MRHQHSGTARGSFLLASLPIPICSGASELLLMRCLPTQTSHLQLLSPQKWAERSANAKPAHFWFCQILACRPEIGSECPTAPRSNFSVRTIGTRKHPYPKILLSQSIAGPFGQPRIPDVHAAQVGPFRAFPSFVLKSQLAQMGASDNCLLCPFHAQKPSWGNFSLLQVKYLNSHK